MASLSDTALRTLLLMDRHTDKMPFDGPLSSETEPVLLRRRRSRLLIKGLIAGCCALLAVALGISALQQPTPLRVAARPGPGNTGVPAGTMLRPYYGNLVLTTPGATYSGLDVHGFVEVKAPNVTIKNSIVRGGVASGNIGLVTDTSSLGTHFLIEDSELVPANPSVWIDGIKGRNYTALRVNIHETVDAAKVYGDNVTIASSWLHATAYYLHDPNQGGGPTHNDGVQVLSGRNIHIIGNTIEGGRNSALQITQDAGAVAALRFTGNWADGGACTVNVADKPRSTMSGITVSNNRFGRTSSYLNCAITVSPGVSLTAIGNTWIDTNGAVAVTPRGK